MKNHEKKKTSLKERFLKKPKKNSVTAAEYEGKMRTARNKSGIPCAFK